MRADYFAVGVIALLIGFMVFMLFYSEVKEHETWAGELARALSPEAEKEYQNREIHNDLRWNHSNNRHSLHDLRNSGSIREGAENLTHVTPVTGLGHNLSYALTYMLLRACESQKGN